jgi:wobble nucleotide-excising tRNase
MTKFSILLILLIFISPAFGATIYKWVDKEGVINFTDDYDKVPPLYRDRVQKEEREDVQKAGPPALSSQTPPTKREEVKTDIYGRDEAWWREKVQPWKDRLNEATENYETAQQIFTKKAEELSKTNFYGRSRSQTKWDVMELDRLNEEKKKYEAQINEANEMLKKLSQEAEESKANPDWLK